MTTAIATTKVRVRIALSLGTNRTPGNLTLAKIERAREAAIVFCGGIEANLHRAVRAVEADRERQLALRVLALETGRALRTGDRAGDLLAVLLQIERSLHRPLIRVDRHVPLAGDRRRRLLFRLLLGLGWIGLLLHRAGRKRCRKRECRGDD